MKPEPETQLHQRRGSALLDFAYPETSSLSELGLKFLFEGLLHGQSKHRELPNIAVPVGFGP